MLAWVGRGVGTGPPVGRCSWPHTGGKRSSPVDMSSGRVSPSDWLWWTVGGASLALTASGLGEPSLARSQPRTQCSSLGRREKR